jgi:hypothetical protein
LGSERETPFLPRTAKACQYFFLKKLAFGLCGLLMSAIGRDH